MSPREEFVKAALNGLCASYTGNTLDAAFVAEVAARAVAIADAAIKELDKPVETYWDKVHGDEQDVGEGRRRLGWEKIVSFKRYLSCKNCGLEMPVPFSRVHNNAACAFREADFKFYANCPKCKHSCEWTNIYRRTSDPTGEVQSVRDLLEPRFPTLEVYRYNSASIRVRIVDSAFAARNRKERVDHVNTYLDKLPPEIQQQIVLLQLFTEEETRISPPVWPE